VKVTETVQVGPILDPQVLVANAKLPVTEMVTGRLEPVELVSIIDWGALVVPTVWLVKVNDEGLKVTPPAAVPVPLSDTLCGDPAALSVMLSVGLQVPATVGAKVTVMVHVPPPDSPVPQVLLWVNGAPGVLIPLIVSGELPE
jgi:hypothetical protein